MSDPDSLHKRILRIDGVAAIYPPDPAWRSLIQAFPAVLTAHKPPSEPTVSVTGDGALTHVHVRIGIHANTLAPSVARKVSREIRDHLAARGTTAGTVSVQICSITDPG